MKALSTPARLLGTSLLALTFAAPAAPAAERSEDRYIVVYERSVANADAETTRQQSARGFKARFRYRRTVKGFAATLSSAQAAGLRRDPDVAAVVPDRPVHASAAVVAGDVVPPGIRRIAAATTTTVRGPSDTAVAVIDTGVDLDHPDLNVESGTNCITPGQSADDDDGHGTHVAGTIAAENDGAGVVGVAPGTEIQAVKVLDKNGNGTWASIICGVEWIVANAATRGIGVANMSLGGEGELARPCDSTGDEDPLHDALCDLAAAGVTPVAAAGNDAIDFRADVPANHPAVLAVTAISDFDGAGGGVGTGFCNTNQTPESDELDDTPATFSNFATRAAEGSHTVAAPGACIRSTVPGGGYARMSGTSMASPHVAGLVALCRSEAGTAGPCAGESNAQVIARIRALAAGAAAEETFGFAGDPLRPRPDEYFGYLATAAFGTTPGEPLNAPPPPPTPPPPPPGSTSTPPPATDPPPATTAPATPTPEPATPVPAIPAAVVAVKPASFSVARVRLASALKRGLRVAVSCPQPCVARSEALRGRTRVAKGSGATRGANPVVVVKFPRDARAKLARLRSVKLVIRTRIAVPGAAARYLKRTVTLRR